MKRVLLLAALFATTLAPMGVAAPARAVTEKDECWGAKGADVYHTSKECPAYKRIKPKNLVTFPDSDAAKKEGRKECKRC